MRLNAQRDPQRLPDDIVEEIAELTGAERIALVLLDEQGKPRLSKAQLPLPAFEVMSGRAVEAPNPEAFLGEIQPWLEEASISRQGFIRQLNPEGSLTEQRLLRTVRTGRPGPVGCARQPISSGGGKRRLVLHPGEAGHRAHD